VGWRSPGRAEQSIIDRAEESIIDTAKTLRRLCAAFAQGLQGARSPSGMGERCRIVCAERGIGQADPCPAVQQKSRCYQACRPRKEL
jgi:hypothetical protein